MKLFIMQLISQSYRAHSNFFQCVCMYSDKWGGSNERTLPVAMDAMAAAESMPATATVYQQKETGTTTTIENNNSDLSAPDTYMANICFVTN